MKNIIALVCFSLSSIPAYAANIRIYTWEDYLSPKMITQFEKQTGHTITQVYFENEHLRDEVITSGRADVYDLVIIDNFALKYMSKNGWMRNYSTESIPNRVYLSKDSLDACGNTGIPYMWGTLGISYRTSQFDHPVTSWSELFTPDKAHYNKITLPLDDIDTIGAALLSLNKNPFTNNIEDLKKAFSLLQSVKPKIKSFRDTLPYALEHRKESNLDIALTYSGDTKVLNDVTGFDDWRYIIPSEGTLLWYECFASLSSKPLSQGTLEFLNFINDPKIAAKNAQEVWYATANKASLKFASNSYVQNKELFPSDKVLKNSYPYEVMPLDSLRTRSKIMSIINRDK